MILLIKNACSNNFERWRMHYQRGSSSSSHDHDRTNFLCTAQFQFEKRAIFIELEQNVNNIPPQKFFPIRISKYVCTEWRKCGKGVTH